MAYSDKVIDHYNNPRNVGSLSKEDPNVGTGLVGAPECGDVMKLQIKVNEESGLIEDAKFKTFGCGSAIASSSLATEWVKGKTLAEALAIKNTDIVKELSLPPVKIHCSVLAEDAIKAAITDWQKKAGATVYRQRWWRRTRGELRTSLARSRRGLRPQGVDPASRVTTASSMFIAGLPMNPATNTLRGRWYSSSGGATCWSTPLRMTDTRSPIVIASI